MKPEQQRIAIAEACGWECFLDNAEGYHIVDTTTGHSATLTRDGRIVDVDNTLPDYLNDLNAMQAAEKTLGPKIWEYRQILQDSFPYSVHSPTESICATAAQRAEAFLRTIGKWEDGK